MKHIKSFEAFNKITIDNLIDKGYNNLTDQEKNYLKDPKNNEEPINDYIENDKLIYDDTVGPYEATLTLYDIENTDQSKLIDTTNQNDVNSWNGKINIITDNDEREYKGYILFSGDDYINGYFSNEKGDIYDDLSEYVYDVDQFLENAFYHLIKEKEENG